VLPNLDPSRLPWNRLAWRQLDRFAPPSEPIDENEDRAPWPGTAPVYQCVRENSRGVAGPAGL